MKKIIAMLLCLCLLAVVFVSCADNGTEETQASSGEQASEKAPETTQQENTDTDKPSETDSGDGWTKFY